ncbi:MAG TPA: Gfo/Idh/MocA family oxidoreductase [Firmicutes bacterium]|nr:Gfo/Idh/MocA family oxidoreductase [Bacillota bacterium]
MNKLRIGIVGGGIRGELFTRAVLQSPFAEHAGMVEPVAEKREGLAKKYGIKTFDNLDELLAAGMDAVIVTTPDHLHKELVCCLGKQGIPMMVEKPFATTFSDALAMAKIIKSHAVPLMVAFENRWNPPFQVAKARIGQEELGELLVANVKLNDSIYVPTKMLSWAAKSTPGWFLLPHVMDILRWLTGREVKTVTARAVKKHLVSMGIDTIDSIQALIVWDNGATAVVETNWVLPENIPSIFDFKVSLHGSKGSIEIDLQRQLTTVAGKRYEWPGVLLTEVDGKLEGHPVWMFEHFLTKLREKKSFSADLYDAVINTAIVEAIHKSAQLETTIDMQPYLEEIAASL